jgi:hypothetical protein
MNAPTTSQKSGQQSVILNPERDSHVYSDQTLNDNMKDILVDTVLWVWDKLEIRYLEHLSETMPHRIEVIVKSQGSYTPY